MHFNHCWLCCNEETADLWNRRNMCCYSFHTQHHDSIRSCRYFIETTNPGFAFQWRLHSKINWNPGWFTGKHPREDNNENIPNLQQLKLRLLLLLRRPQWTRGRTNRLLVDDDANEDAVLETVSVLSPSVVWSVKLLWLWYCWLCISHYLNVYYNEQLEALWDCFSSITLCPYCTYNLFSCHLLETSWDSVIVNEGFRLMFSLQHTP